LVDGVVETAVADVAGRTDILRAHTRTVPLADDMDLDRLVAATPGMTDADRANLVNEAALAAARKGQSEVTTRLIDGCYADARQLLRENRGRLDNIATDLLETLDEAQVYAAAGIVREAATV